MRISHTMHLAVQAVLAGAKPREAAAEHGVNIQSLYKALARYKVGARCPTCNRAMPERKVPYEPLPEPPDYEARVSALEAQGLTRSDAQGVVDAEEMQRPAFLRPQAE